MRYFIQFSYNGTRYHGWQIQPNATSVQEVLEKSLHTLLKSPIKLTGAGRTDTGVHAKQMYAHFDFTTSFDFDTTVYKLNAILPQDIAVDQILPVHDTAHVRFDATSRTYKYYIHTQKDVFSEHLSWMYRQPLDLELMNQAAKVLSKYTDFECFSKSNTDVNTFNCRIDEAFWQQENNCLIFTITADRFLRNMVRAIVGTLINIGLHKLEINDLENIIKSKDRSQAGFSVPAHGLYLVQIKYPYICL